MRTEKLSILALGFCGFTAIAGCGDQGSSATAPATTNEGKSGEVNLDLQLANGTALDSDPSAHPVHHAAQRNQPVRWLPGPLGNRERCHESHHRSEGGLVRRGRLVGPLVLLEPGLHRGRRLDPGRRSAVSGASLMSDVTVTRG